MLQRSLYSATANCAAAPVGMTENPRAARPVTSFGAQSSRLGRRALPEREKKRRRRDLSCPDGRQDLAAGGKTLGMGGCITGAEAGMLAVGASSRGPVLSFRYTSGGQRAAKVAPNHPGTAARSQNANCEVRIEATTASSPECVCAGVGQPIECPDFTQKEKSQ
jgi:hypothetical protein